MAAFAEKRMSTWADKLRNRVSQLRQPAPASPPEALPPAAQSAAPKAAKEPAPPPADDAEWVELTAWFAAARLPAVAYAVGPGVEVTDPVRNHAWLRDRIAEAPSGQVRRALLVRLRRLRELFGGTS